MSRQPNLVEDLFHGAVDLTSDERQRFLASECGDDPDIRKEVEALLAAYDVAPTFLERPFLDSDSADSEAGSAEGRTVGSYRLLEKIGEGGMGAVFLAEQRRPIKRRVALKLIRGTMPSEELLRRFEAERQALAMMQNANIAQVYEAGSTRAGEPYFVMEYIDGKAITAHCDEHRLGVRERVELMIAVCDGVQHAHQKGVIHRDLKPSNVLVESNGSAPTPKIIDFGIAKAIDEPLHEDTLFTGSRVLGTPAYLSPERITREGDVDTRTDIYALGVILYELLTGHLPFKRETDGYYEMAQRVVEEDPPRPTDRISMLSEDAADDVARRRLTDVAALKKLLRKDLEWITMKAMARERDRRYSSAAEFAADLRRHLADEPVLACPPSTSYRLRKFARRHSTAVISGALLILAMLAGIVGTTVQAHRATREAERANREAERANREADAAVQTTEFLVGLFDVADPEKGRGETITAREILDKGAERIDVDLADQPVIRARLLHTIGRVYWSLGMLDQAASNLEEAMAIRGEQLGETSVEYGSSSDMLANIYGRQGRLEEAEKHHKRAIAIWQDAGREDKIPNALQHLGVVYRGQGRYQESEELYLEAIARLEDEGPSRALAVVLDNLAGLYDEIGRLEEVEPLMRRSVEVLEQAVDPEHPLLATHRSKLAIALYITGHLDEAIELSKESLRVIEKTHPENHTGVAYQLYVYGGLNRVAGRLEEAEVVLSRSAEIYAAAEREDMPWLSRALGELAQVQVALGKWDEAEAAARRALEATQAQSEATAVDIANTELAVAAVMLMTEQYDEALDFAESARSRFEGDLGEDNINTALAKDLLGDINARLGRHDVAEQLYRETLATAEAVLGPENPALASVLVDLGFVLREQGRTEEAEQAEQRAAKLAGDQPKDGDTSASEE